MSESVPEIFDTQNFRHRLVENLPEPDIYIARSYQREIKRYKNGGRISRWLIGRLYPEVADYVDRIDVQQSAAVARRRDIIRPTP